MGQPVVGGKARFIQRSGAALGSRSWALLATAAVLPLAVACSGEAAVEAEANGDENVGSDTVPLLVDFEPDPSMFFGESEEEQARARAAIRKTFGGDIFPERSPEDTVSKRVNTDACIEFSIPPFTGPGGVERFFNTVPVEGVTPISVCGPRTIGESRRFLIENFSAVSRPGPGTITVGAINASVEECADLSVAMAVAEDRGPGESTRVLFSSLNEEAELQQGPGGTVCASFVSIFGGPESAATFEGKDLWIAVQAVLNDDGVSSAFQTKINDRVLVKRLSDLGL